MKKNRLIPLLLALALLGGLLAGCNNSPSTDGQGGADDYRVILLIPGNLGDKSFFDSANAGMTRVKNELTNVTTKVVEMGTDETNWEPSILDATEEGWDLIISGNSASDIMNAIAENNPEQKFMNFDNSSTDAPANVYSVSYATNEASFLGGALAGLVTQSDMANANSENIIGFLGGMDIPGINDFLVGYIQGAQAVNENIKVITSYAGNFADPVQGKELSLLQYQSGADIIFCCAGQTGLGGIDAAYEQGKYALGVDSDQAALYAETAPEKAELIISSVVKYIDNVIFNGVVSAMDGSLSYGTHSLLGLAQDAVGLAENEYYEAIPEEYRNAIDSLKTQVVNGEITIQSAFQMTTEAVESYRNSVTP